MCRKAAVRMQAAVEAPRREVCGTGAQEKGRVLCLKGSYRENSLLPAVFAAWPPGENSANRVVTLARAALAKSSAEMPCLPKSAEQTASIPENTWDWPHQQSQEKTRVSGSPLLTSPSLALISVTSTTFKHSPYFCRCLYRSYRYH